MSYFDNDYLDVPSYEFLQRYPKVYAGTNVHLDGEVAKIISEAGKRYEIVLWVIQSFTEYFANKYPLDEADYQSGGFYDKPFYIAEPENQSNAKFTSYRLYTKRGMIEDTKTGTDNWLIGNDPNIERYLEFSADFEHYFLFTLDHKIEKLTLEYYDQNFSKIWKREFENTVSAYYDYTKNNIYLSADNSLYIIDLATGEDTFQHTFIGEKQEIRKMADGVLCIGFTKSDAIMKTDLEGNILWAASVTENVNAVDGIQFVDNRIILQLELFDGVHFIVVDSDMYLENEVLQKKAKQRRRRMDRDERRGISGLRP